jgi:hypothetical protein
MRLFLNVLSVNFEYVLRTKMIECIDVSDDKRLKEPSIVAYLVFGLLSTLTFASFSIKDEPLFLAGLLAIEFLGCMFFFRMTGRYSLLLARDMGREARLAPNYELKRYVPMEHVESLQKIFKEDNEDFETF